MMITRIVFKIYIVDFRYKFQISRVEYELEIIPSHEEES